MNADENYQTITFYNPPSFHTPCASYTGISVKERLNLKMESTKINSENALVVFQGMKIRRTWFNDEWWFSVVDIIGALMQTDSARKYWSDLKVKLTEEGFQLSEKIGQLKLKFGTVY